MDETINLEPLLRLLDDPDTSSIAALKITEMGPSILPHLKKHLNNPQYNNIYTELSTIIDNIHTGGEYSDIQIWLNSDDSSLLEALLILMRRMYPYVDEALVLERLEAIKASIWLEVNDNMTLVNKLQIVNHMLFSVHGFGIATTTTDHSYFLNSLLETKEGSADIVTMLFAVIAQEMGMSISPSLPLGTKSIVLECYTHTPTDEDGGAFFFTPHPEGIRKIDISNTYTTNTQKKAIAKLVEKLVCSSNQSTSNKFVDIYKLFEAH